MTRDDENADDKLTKDDNSNESFIARMVKETKKKKFLQRLKLRSTRVIIAPEF